METESKTRIVSIILGISIFIFSVYLTLAVVLHLLGFTAADGVFVIGRILYSSYKISSVFIPLILLYASILLIIPGWQPYSKAVLAGAPIYFFSFVLGERFLYFLLPFINNGIVQEFAKIAVFLCTVLLVLIEIFIVMNLAEKRARDKIFAPVSEWEEEDIVGNELYSEDPYAADPLRQAFAAEKAAEQTSGEYSDSEDPAGGQTETDENTDDPVKPSAKKGIIDSLVVIEQAEPEELSVLEEYGEYGTVTAPRADNGRSTEEDSYAYGEFTENGEAKMPEHTEAPQSETVEPKRAVPETGESGEDGQSLESAQQDAFFENDSYKNAAPAQPEQEEAQGTAHLAAADYGYARTFLPEAALPKSGETESPAIDYADEEEDGSENMQVRYGDADDTENADDTKEEEHFTGETEQFSDDNSCPDDPYAEGEEPFEETENEDFDETDDFDEDDDSDGFDGTEHSFETEQSEACGTEDNSSAENGGALYGNRESAEIPQSEGLREPVAITAAKPLQPKAQEIKRHYHIPFDLLTKYPGNDYWIIDDSTRTAAIALKNTFEEFNINIEITGIRKGPVVTMFEVLPPPGIKLGKITALQDNIALRLAAQSVRIVAPIPGKQAVGIEVPNKSRAIVGFRELIETEIPETNKMAIPIVLGKDVTGEPQTLDLCQTPHLLIAGATGSGKSVCVNSIILSILYNKSPEEVKLLLVDPKIVELKLYNGIGHLLTPVITEPKRALQGLQYCICEMERRYAMLDGMSVRDIKSYNKKIRREKIAAEALPYIVIIIDEFADLMATTGKELEATVSRLCAMSRAVGIHLVLATQRPSTNVITGLIKANIPSRIAFMVASRVDSQIILDNNGAEKLLGKGDMLYVSTVNPFPGRIQGTFVSDEEVEKVVECVKTFGEPEYIDDEIFFDEDDYGQDTLFDEESDPLYDEALEIVMQEGKASASYIQRKLKIGYNRAARIVEEMEARGVVGPANGSKPREVISQV